MHERHIAALERLPSLVVSHLEPGEAACSGSLSIASRAVVLCRPSFISVDTSPCPQTQWITALTYLPTRPCTRYLHWCDLLTPPPHHVFFIHVLHVHARCASLVRLCICMQCSFVLHRHARATSRNGYMHTYVDLKTVKHACMGTVPIGLHVLPLSGIPRKSLRGLKTRFGNLLRCKIDSMGLGLGVLTLFLKQQKFLSTIRFFPLFEKINL